MSLFCNHDIIIFKQIRYNRKIFYESFRICTTINLWRSLDSIWLLILLCTLLWSDVSLKLLIHLTFSSFNILWATMMTHAFTLMKRGSYTMSEKKKNRLWFISASKKYKQFDPIIQKLAVAHNCIKGMNTSSFYSLNSQK